MGGGLWSRGRDSKTKGKLVTWRVEGCGGNTRVTSGIEKCLAFAGKREEGRGASEEGQATEGS